MLGLELKPGSSILMNKSSGPKAALKFDLFQLLIQSPHVIEKPTTSHNKLDNAGINIIIYVFPYQVTKIL